MILAAIFLSIFGNPATANCQYEDGSEMLYGASYSTCKWDAGQSGNGIGETFVAIKVNTTIVYLYQNGTIEK